MCPGRKRKMKEAMMTKDLDKQMVKSKYLWKKIITMTVRVIKASLI